jgi:hypothetical protein
MIARLIDRARATLRLSPIYNLLLPLRLLLERERWRVTGRVGPTPALVKQITVRCIARQCGIRVFVETGTYLGTMVNAVKTDFDSIWSLELDARLAARASKRFERYDHILVVVGDSAETLGALVRQLERPAIFWLDAHYSGGVTASRGDEGPILGEIEAIANSAIAARHIILVDDARLFVGSNAYPTMERMLSTLSLLLPAHRVSVVNDMILATPADSVLDLRFLARMYHASTPECSRRLSGMR